MDQPSTETASLISVNNHRIASYVLDAGRKTIVIFCHGFRGDAVGPSRFFVVASRLLGEHNISSLRFDQYGSGNSEGEFLNSSFNDWVATILAMVEKYKNEGYKVGLFGQSMGSAAAIMATSASDAVSCAVLWVPDPNIEEFNPPNDIMEEGGQIVKAQFWQEAYDANIAEQLSKMLIPAYIVQCSDDEYVSAQNHRAIADNARSNHTVEMFENLKHSAWSYDEATEIIQKSVSFLVDTLQVV